MDDESITKIISLEVNKLVKRLGEKKYTIKVDPTVITEIKTRNSQEEFGARPIKRIIQSLIEDYLSDEILKGSIKQNRPYTLRYKDDKLVLR